MSRSDASPDEPRFQTIAEAEAFLAEMATALFPLGEFDLFRLTWADRPELDQVVPDALDPEARLRAAEMRYRTLVEQIPAVTFMAVLGQGKNEIYISSHIEKLLGYTQREWLDDPFLWYWRLHPDDRQLWNEEFARGCRTGGPFRAECRFLARDGSVVWVHGEARLVRDDQRRPLFLQGVAFDITDSKLAQEVLLAQAVLAAKHEEDQEIARRAQTSILPRNIAITGLEVAVAMVPASEVGGDFYDVLPSPGGCWIAIGDVTGHGLDAGLLMMMVQSALSALVHARPFASPSELIEHLNEVMFDNIRRRLGRDDHITMTLLRYTSEGTLVFAGAHEDILVLRKGAVRVETVATPGTWIGAAASVRRSTVESTLVLGPGDLAVLFSDGITEARRPSGELYDLPRLCAAVERVRDASPEVIRDHVLREVQDFAGSPADDMTLLVLRQR